jgi:hypothetical protein
MDAIAAVIQPSWTLVFCKNRGPWWVRLLACGRYHHVKAIVYLPSMRAWLFYDVKFNLTRLMLAHEEDPSVSAFLRDYLDNCDTIAMPLLPMPKRAAPQVGFWCTLAMKHLVGIRSSALRPDRLWRDCIAAGGKPYIVASTGDYTCAVRASDVRRQHPHAITQFPEHHADALRSSRRILVGALWARIKALRQSSRRGAVIGGGRPRLQRGFAYGPSPSA